MFIYQTSHLQYDNCMNVVRNKFTGSGEVRTRDHLRVKQM